MIKMSLKLIMHLMSPLFTSFVLITPIEAHMKFQTKYAINGITLIKCSSHYEF